MGKFSLKSHPQLPTQGSPSPTNSLIRTDPFLGSKPIVVSPAQMSLTPKRSACKQSPRMRNPACHSPPGAVLGAGRRARVTVKHSGRVAGYSRGPRGKLEEREEEETFGNSKKRSSARQCHDCRKKERPSLPFILTDLRIPTSDLSPFKFPHLRFLCMCGERMVIIHYFLPLRGVPGGSVRQTHISKFCSQFISTNKKFRSKQRKLCPWKQPA